MLLISKGRGQTHGDFLLGEFRTFSLACVQDVTILVIKLAGVQLLVVHVETGRYLLNRCLVATVDFDLLISMWPRSNCWLVAGRLIDWVQQTL